MQLFVWSFIFFPLSDLLLWVQGGRGGDPKWWRVTRCCQGRYQLLSGEGSLSRCIEALWCFMLSRYSCCETARTDARISSSSQSVRPKTHKWLLQMKHITTWLDLLQKDIKFLHWCCGTLVVCKGPKNLTWSSLASTMFSNLTLAYTLGQTKSPFMISSKIFKN